MVPWWPYLVDFREDFGCDTSERLFNQDAITDKSTLHCTAKFFSRNEALDKSYLKTASEHCSQVSAIKVSGFVISGRTFGAKVDLSEDQMSLYRQDDYEIIRHTLNPSDPQEPNGNKAHLTIGKWRLQLYTNRAGDKRVVRDSPSSITHCCHF